MSVVPTPKEGRDLSVLRWVRWSSWQRKIPYRSVVETEYLEGTDCFSLCPYLNKDCSTGVGWHDLQGCFQFACPTLYGLPLVHSGMSFRDLSRTWWEKGFRTRISEEGVEKRGVVYDWNLMRTSGSRPQIKMGCGLDRSWKRPSFHLRSQEVVNRLLWVSVFEVYRLVEKTFLVEHIKGVS